MIQLQAINYILENRDPTFITLNNLNDEFFSDYKEEFNFIKNHLSKYNNIPDKETFLSSFPNFDIITVNEKSNYLIDELYKDRNSRTLASTFNKVRESLLNNNVDEAMRLFTQNAEKMTTALHLDCVDITKDLSRYDTYIERSRDFTKSYVKTGWKELDNIIGGWDRNEEYATIVARSNFGKSWLALKTAVAAAEQGLRVGIYSGEMTDQKVGYRIDTLISHISNIGLTHGRSEVQNDYKQYLDNLNKLIPGSILVLTPQMIGEAAGVTILKAFIEKEHLDMLVVDQHSLLEDDRKAKSPVERAANISRDIKNLQVLKKIPIITVSQQNRESTENGMDTRLIAQSDRIGQDSTIVIFLEKKDNVMTLSLVKSRDSVNGKKLQYLVDLDKGTFTYIPTESDALGGQESEELRAQFDDIPTDGDNVF